ncbi:MAG: hypothetical protein M1819_006250 [Sarea resinae]|nr:MAG: hypothetical protein M1819_006250 [Sarea resinae]
MAPLEPDLSNSNLRAYFTLGSVVISSATLVSLVLYSTAKAFTSLPPSQGTRFRESHRKNHVAIFAALAVTSLSFSLYNKIRFFVESYKNWAYERGESIPRGVWGKGGVYGGEDAVGMQLGRWIHDTKFGEEFWETNIEGARGFWWTQQVFLGTVAWGVFLSVEGRRRQIPHLWAYALLAQCLSLPFAQNLFYLAILFHPVSTEANRTPKAPTASKWTPSTTTLQLMTLIPTYANIFLLPFASNTPSFSVVLFLCRALPFLSLLYPYIISPSTSQFNTSTLSKTISCVSLLLHLKSTLFGLTAPLPSEHHLDFLPDALTPQRYQQHHSTASAASQLLSAPSQNTALRTLAHDVLLATISLVLWAGLRGLDPVAMLRAAGVPGFAIKEIPGLEGVEERLSSADQKEKDLPNGVSSADDAEQDDQTSRRSARKSRGSGRGRGRGGRRNSTASSAPSGGSKQDGRSSTRGRRSGNKARTSGAAAANENDNDDGNEDENTAPFVPDEKTAEATAAGSGGGGGGWEADDTDTAPNVEAGVLGWCLCALGGLGVGGAAVWGGA